MARRTYTPDQRAEAVALYLEHGGAEASRQCGIPDGTIKAWASREGATTERHDNLAAAVEARVQAWDVRRTDLAHRIGEVAEKALMRTEAALEGAGTPKDAQAYATTMAILADKAQLLTGGATSRSEHATAASVSEKLADVVDIGSKRAA